MIVGLVIYEERFIAVLTAHLKFSVGADLQPLANNDQKPIPGQYSYRLGPLNDLTYICTPSLSTCLPQTDDDGAMNMCFVMTRKVVHVAETTGVKVRQISVLVFLALYRLYTPLNMTRR